MGTRRLLKMALYGYKTSPKINEQHKTGKELRLLENVAEQIHSTSNSKKSTDFRLEESLIGLGISLQDPIPP